MGYLPGGYLAGYLSSCNTPPPPFRRTVLWRHDYMAAYLPAILKARCYSNMAWGIVSINGKWKRRPLWRGYGELGCYKMGGFRVDGCGCLLFYQVLIAVPVLKQNQI